VCAALAALLAGGCMTSDPERSSLPTDSAQTSVPPTRFATPTPGPTIGVTVFAAASLAAPLDQARRTFGATHGAWEIQISTDSSAALATQIEQGAPADVFLSADTANPQRLVDSGIAEAPPIVFASNLLAIVVPSENAARIDSWQDLAREGIRIVAAGEAVPITRYATQLVANLAALPDGPGDFANAYAANVVSREDNVKALIAKIELGEGDAAIVYRTDAAASSRVRVIDIPVEANVPATYAGVVIAGSDDVLAARAFLSWFSGKYGGQAILARYGFLPPPR